MFVFKLRFKFSTGVIVLVLYLIPILRNFIVDEFAKTNMLLLLSYKEHDSSPR